MTVVCFAATQRISFTQKFKLPFPQYLFKKNKTLKNRYKRNQPIHFSVTPLRPELKKRNSKTRQPPNLGRIKKNDA